MFDNFILYEVKTEGFIFREGFQLPSNYPAIQSIQFVQENGSMMTMIRLNIEPGISEADALVFGEHAIRHILAVIAWETNKLVGAPRKTAHFINGSGEGSVALRGNVTVRSSDNIIQNIQAKICRNDTLSTAHLLYRDALYIENHIGQFFSLYSILSLLKGSQFKVDQFILSLEPEVEICLGTNGRRDETIYTYLRNQLGHMQINTDIYAVDRKILLLIDNLERYVKLVIEEQYPIEHE